MDSRPPTEQDPPLQTVLTSLTDEDCRRILKLLTEPMSAREIAEECEIPLSTTYRKLNILSSASLVTERLDVGQQGKHTTRYVTDFETVTVSRNEEGEILATVESDRPELNPPMSFSQNVEQRS